MSMSDPISDLLTRIRNANRAGQGTVDIPASKIKADICRVLKEEGFIKDYAFDEEAKPARLRVSLKYTGDRTPILQGLRRVSKPSLRVYRKNDEMRPVRSGLGISILSTSKGVMTGKRARQEKVGGEVLCEVW
ncbi:MAG: 30S ribosomal protein S8 [Candidatus Hydrogenedentes bacterium]|nr:30S ribosomal protein S8 [Candidatus Hydrogenedentota bacterium]